MLINMFSMSSQIRFVNDIDKDSLIKYDPHYINFICFILTNLDLK